ncbi:MAG: hypothetical protein ACJZ1Q_04775 [Candidatus Neomarinimicrobiota bacterium]
MKKIIILFIGSFIIQSCSSEKVITEREIFKQKLEAFQFLSKYHHQLHIMIGEEDGDPEKAFDEFVAGVNKINNPELTPVKNALERVKPYKVESDPVLRLDYLVDYYQSGLSLQVEAMLRAYGFLKVVPMDSALIIYDEIID